jgi:hypothetical protein
MTQLGHSQMDASLHLCAGDFLETAGGFLDRIVAWLVIPDAACQSLGYVLWRSARTVCHARPGM